VVATSTIILNTASAHWVAIYMHADNSGSCEVWFNGALIVSYTGDLQDTATPGWQSVRWSANNQDLYYDDIIVTTEEEGRLDECYIVPLAPDGDDVTALTPSTGVDNFAMVDEVPPSTTDYNETLVTAEDFYDLEALPSTFSRVVMLGHNSYVARDGTITTAQMGIKSGATTDRQTAITLGAAATYEEVQGMWLTDPNTSTAVAAVDTGSDTVAIAGDLTAIIVDNSFIEITGSTGNDGTYVVASTTFSSPNTDITVAGDITDATVDGNVTYNWTETTVNAAKSGIKFA